MSSVGVIVVATNRHARGTPTLNRHLRGPSTVDQVNLHATRCVLISGQAAS